MYTKRVMRDRRIRNKIFLAFEGAKTEPRYFGGLVEKEQKNINVEVIPLHRGWSAFKMSNPLIIVEMVCDYIQWRYKGIHSVNLFVEQVLYSFHRRTAKSTAGMFNELKQALMGSEFADGNIIKDREGALDLCMKRLYTELSLPSRRPGGEPEDIEDAKFFIIVDRDPDSFTKEQCDNVYTKCKSNKFELIVSNPSFDLWLLLHFDIEKDEILEDTTPEVLKKILRNRFGQEHSNLDFDVFHPMIGHARRRLKNEGYCECLENLLSEPDCNGKCIEAHVGSNIGALMDIIFEKQYP